MIAEMTHNMPVRCFLIDADSDGFDGRRDRWLRDSDPRSADAFLGHHDAIGRGAAAAGPAGTGRKDIERTPALQAGGRVLPCMESDSGGSVGSRRRAPDLVCQSGCSRRAETRCSLRTRQGLRLSHRLLLILAPADPKQADAFAQAQWTIRTFRVLRWGDAGYSRRLDPSDDRR